MCPKHGSDFLEYKCRYCCSVAVFFCFGTTHFCNQCHDDFQRVTNIPKTSLPHCPAGQLHLVWSHFPSVSTGFGCCCCFVFFFGTVFSPLFVQGIFLIFCLFGSFFPCCLYRCPHPVCTFSYCLYRLLIVDGVTLMHQFVMTITLMCLWWSWHLQSVNVHGTHNLLLFLSLSLFMSLTVCSWSCHW